MTEKDFIFQYCLLNGADAFRKVDISRRYETDDEVSEFTNQIDTCAENLANIAEAVAHAIQKIGYSFDEL